MGGYGREIRDYNTGAMMINVQAQVIEEYLTDSVNKEIVINGSHTKWRTLDDVNYYTGGIESPTITLDQAQSGGFWLSPTASDYEWVDYCEWDYKGAKYICVAMDLRVLDFTGLATTTGKWRLNYANAQGIYNIVNLGNVDISEYYGSGDRLVLHIPTPADGISKFRVISFVADDTSTTVQWRVIESNVQINFVGDEGYTPKYAPAPNFSVFDPTLFTPYELDNNALLYEDFALTESLCSQKNIKFGLCEAAHLEFSEVGADIRVGDVISALSTLPDYGGGLTDDELRRINWYDGPYDPSHVWYGDKAWNIHQVYVYAPFYNSTSGFYVGLNYSINKCVYVGDNIDYFSDKYVAALIDVKLKDIVSTLNPTYFKIFWYCEYFCTRQDGTTFLTGKHFGSDDTYLVSDALSDFVRSRVNIPPTYPISGQVVSRQLWYITYPEIQFYDANGNAYAQYSGTIDYKSYLKDPQFNILASVDDNVLPYTKNDCYIYNRTLNRYLAEINSIPLGYFNVTSVANEYKHNVIRKRITAYDNLLSLEDNAADWYTRYMFGVDFYGYTDAGFEYARQIFSTYWDFVSSVGLDSIDNYDLTEYAALSDNDFICDSGNCYGYVRWDMGVGNYYYRSYAGKNVAISDNTLLYRVTYDNYLGLSDESIMQSYNPHYVDSGFDTMLRGFGTIGGVLIEEYKTGENDPINRICVNRGDFFMLTPETDSIKVILPSGSASALGYSLCQNVKVQTAPRRQDLVNGYLRLCYYNYVQKTIFACDSSITGRDVVRSLLEVCGCFFRLDRYNGLPEFVYPTKGGLYPSNTLYPADDLYPRAGTDQLYSMGKYISVTAENYEVKDFGRIQILKKIKSSATESVVEWQYEGDPDSENTYIIDDNIFYCAEEMEYDYDGMPEVADMLAGMWGVISNLGYVPNITQALGAPWLECGDRVGLLTFDGGFETFVFRRTLKGIQNLRDTYESEGDELNVAISNFGYSV